MYDTTVFKSSNGAIACISKQMLVRSTLEATDDTKRQFKALYMQKNVASQYFVILECLIHLLLQY